MIAMNEVYQGCVYLVLRSGRQRYLGRFNTQVEYDTLLTLSIEHCRAAGVALHGVVKGMEVSGEFTPREATRLG
jgi:hypothetical protein